MKKIPEKKHTRAEVRAQVDQIWPEIERVLVGSARAKKTFRADLVRLVLECRNQMDETERHRRQGASDSRRTAKMAADHLETFLELVAQIQGYRRGVLAIQLQARRRVTLFSDPGNPYEDLARTVHELRQALEAIRETASVDAPRGPKPLVHEHWLIAMIAIHGARRGVVERWTLSDTGILVTVCRLALQLVGFQRSHVRKQVRAALISYNLQRG